jgi:hypothetical protein
MLHQGRLTWVESEGGPLLLVAEDRVTEWEGIRQPSAGRVVEATFRWAEPDAPATDYDRACDVPGHTGLIRVGDGEAIVLGDEAMATTCWDGRGAGPPMLARWAYADDEASIIRALSVISDD